MIKKIIRWILGLFKDEKDRTKDNIINDAKYERAKRKYTRRTKRRKPK